jgi:hypothetical protein
VQKLVSKIIIRSHDDTVLGVGDLAELLRRPTELSTEQRQLVLMASLRRAIYGCEGTYSKHSAAAWNAQSNTGLKHSRRVSMYNRW